MPIYEYHCTKCNDDFEVTQKVTESPLSDCPRCGGSVEKLISQSSFVLKGSGWYMTDYSRKEGGKESKDQGTSCAQSGSKPACAGCPSAGE